MKKDNQIEQDVKAELLWEPILYGETVTSKVIDGSVTLTGTVNSYSKKIEAERAVRRVAGVKSVINELEVKLPVSLKKEDSELQTAITNSIKWNSSIDEKKIRVDVKNGWVTLEGMVDWDFQKSKARILAEDINGVLGVTNHIVVATNIPTTSEIREKINAAFKRNYYLNPEKINIRVDGSKVILSGEVRTLSEKQAAERGAWAAPGITQVKNDLEVKYMEIFA
jgi:osmotically-inducible protein OsmY